VLVVAVDHGLRPEAAEEARMVVANAAQLGLKARIMEAPERYHGGNLQDWARRMRYRCLAAAAGEAGFDTIVTAHHQDDQAETFLLRLARGSGVYGLAAMPAEGSVEGLRLARPLIGVSRRKLREIAAASGLPTAADPSNLDLRFDRVRVRQLMPALAEHGLTPVRLAETAGRMRRAAAALDHYARRLLAEWFADDPFGVVSGEARALAEAPEEIGLRALALMLRAVGGAEYTSRLERIESLRDAILALRPDEGLKRTLHGVVLSVKGGRLTARREWGRKGLAAVAAPPGTSLVWDRRFRVEVPKLPGALDIGPLGRSERRLRAEAADRGTVQALPGLFRDGALVAVPAGVSAADQAAPLERLAAKSIVGQRLAAEDASPA
jgi:tRNA(Ile)-lysidine synthase